MATRIDPRPPKAEAVTLRIVCAVCRATATSVAGDQPNDPAADWVIGPLEQHAPEGPIVFLCPVCARMRRESSRAIGGGA